MLNNQADAFFLVPMRTSIIKGGNRGGPQMPEPRPYATETATSLKFLGADPAAPAAPAPTSKVIPLVAAGVVGLALWMFAR